MAAAASVHARSIRITSSRRSVVRSNAAKCNRSCAGVRDSCLVRSEEGYGVGQCVGLVPADRHGSRRTHRGSRCAGPDQTQEAPSADCAHVTTVAVSCDSGSASASTDAASRFT